MNNNNINPEKDSKNIVLKHGLIMMLCCLIPIVIILGLPLFGISGGFIYNLVFLLCPVLHIGMMFMMRKSNHNNSCHSHNKGQDLR